MAGLCPALGPEFRLVQVDLPGDPSGAEDVAGDGGFAGQARLVAALLDELGVGCCHVVGHGLGGIVAQALAIERPERLHALVLVGTSPEPLPADVRAELRAALASDTGGPPVAAEACSAALLGFQGFVERLYTIVTPTLIVVGDADAPFVQRGADLLHGWIPFSRLVRIPNAGHQPQLDNPATFNADVLAFLREVQAIE